jgi:hypothetical protein
MVWRAFRTLPAVWPPVSRRACCCCGGSQLQSCTVSFGSAARLVPAGAAGSSDFRLLELNADVEAMLRSRERSDAACSCDMLLVL